MGSFCQKSTANTTVAPSIIAELPRKSCNVLSKAWKAFLRLMVASSQIISLQVLRTCPCPVPLEILLVALSDLAKSSGNLKAECAVRPPASRVATKKYYVYLPLLCVFSKEFSLKCTHGSEQAHGALLLARGGQSE
ncbi:hypothetical protein TNIN_1621, partial [Trichonephila inaurata madagascariensis]